MMTRSRQAFVMAEISSVMTTILRRGGGPPQRGSHRHPCRHLIVVVLILMACLRCRRHWMRRRKQGRIDPGVRNRIRIIILPLSQLWVGNYYISLLMCVMSVKICDNFYCCQSTIHAFFFHPSIFTCVSHMKQQRTTISTSPALLSYETTEDHNLRPPPLI